MTGPAQASIVIPAHNEESVIARCLSALADQLGIDDLEVVVVANGCSDATAAVARGFGSRFERLQVIEVAEPSKANALNVGDAASASFPRIYLDADIELGAGALASLVTTLRCEDAVVAAPTVDFDTKRASRLVQSYYAVYRQLPYVTSGLVGLGVYGLSESGRSRFGKFPGLMGDDLFVQRHFSESERRRSEHSFTVRAPRTVRDLVKVRTRVALGNAELAEASMGDAVDTAPTSSSTLRGLADLARHNPRSAPAAAVYVAVVLAARLRASRTGGVGWMRDDSTRLIDEPTAPGGGLAFLVSQYPAPSHIFVEREIKSLRERGVRVETFSVRPTPPELLLSDLMREEEGRTTVLLADQAQLLGASLRLLLRHPGAVARAFARAGRTGEATMRGRTWQLFYLVEAILLRREMQRRGLNHVHVHFANNGADIARAMVALSTDIDGPGHGWKWTLSMHGPTEFENVGRVDLSAKVMSAAAVACISDFTRSQVMRLVPDDTWDRLSIVRMSVDTERFRPPAAGRQHAGALRVLFVGRLVPEKGPSVLIEALDRLRERGVEVDARMAGDGPLRGRLHRDVGRRSLSDRVTLWGAVGQDEILDLYHWADVFCLPSFQEGLPVVLMEAMATELPVVTTQIAGIPELVQDGVTGRAIPAGRSDLLAASIAELNADVGMRSRLGTAGRQRVLQLHATDVTATAQAAFFAQFE